MENSPNLFKRNIWLYGGGTLFVLLLVYVFFLSAPSSFPKGTIVNVPDGASLRSISLELKSKHIIRSRTAFEAFVVLYGGERHVVSADYLFESSEPVFEVARRVSKGERHLAPVKVTIPEGYNASEIAELFGAKLPNFNKDKFFLEARPKEGYLFPDTYFFFTTDNEQNALLSMSNNFEKKIKPILPEIVASRKSEKDIINMASVVEKEANGNADRALISGILWRRLSIGMALQVDAAPETYQTRGLPKYPISNPGLAAIKAAIHPETSPYLYYLHDKEGNIHFAKTFAEHKENKLKYLNTRQ